MEEKLWISAASRKEWRDWLRENHNKVDEAWLIYFKKATGKASISYPDSVEEAICFGWIDGLKKRIDEERYTHRFSPRRPGSRWSEINIHLAEKMIREEKMTAAGLECFHNRREYKKQVVALINTKEIRLPPEIEEALKSNEKAWKNYQQLAPSHRKQYAAWLSLAKKPETRQKRITEAIRLLEQDEKLGMK